MTENEKKKNYIILAVFVIILMIFAKFYLPSLFPSFKNISGEEKPSSSPDVFTEKYKGLRKIEAGFLNDERFKALQYPSARNYEEPKIGNPKPFSNE